MNIEQQGEYRDLIEAFEYCLFTPGYKDSRYITSMNAWKVLQAQPRRLSSDIKELPVSAYVSIMWCILVLLLVTVVFKRTGSKTQLQQKHQQQQQQQRQAEYNESDVNFLFFCR